MADEVEINLINLSDDEIIKGPHYARIERTVPEDSRKQLFEETFTIIQRLNYSGETGLILGKIQSGKTTSFEAVAALARDNGVPLTIVLGGISKILCLQTYGRIRRDFGVAEGSFQWSVNTTLKENDRAGVSSNFSNELQTLLTSWLDPNVDERLKKAVLLVAMKNYLHIESITNALLDPQIQQLLRRTKVLIIDDEADQYSLNVPRNKKLSDDSQGVVDSTTFVKIKNLRDACPNHSFLQYTATPGAPFLLNLIDPLSPDFAELVNPGDGYTGMDELFFEGSDYVKSTEVEEPLESIPEDLKNALAIFLLGFASGVNRDFEGGNRSMLVHPSRLIGVHEEYYTFIETEIELMKDILRDQNHPQYSSYKQMFKEQYEDLQATVNDLDNFDSLFEQLPNYWGQLKIELVNSGENSTCDYIDWTSSYGFIIVSGQAVDRGTTVEGLTVTYMPRFPSQQSDTQTQRARFLGYKNHYKGFIRVYSDAAAMEFYTNYGWVENDFRNLVMEYSGQDFKDAVREWKLVKGTRTCRPSVISLTGSLVVNNKKSGRWTHILSPHKEDYNQINEVIDDFLDSQQLLEYPLDTRYQNLVSDSMKHNFVELDFRTLYEELISKIVYRYHRNSTNWYNAFHYMMHMYFEEEDQGHRALLLEMSPGYERKRSAKKQTQFSEISRFHQGAYPDANKARALRSEYPSISKGSVYGGDAKCYDKDKLTLQIFTFTIKDENDVEHNSVKTISLRLPDSVWEKFDLQIEDRVKQRREDETEYE